MQFPLMTLLRPDVASDILNSLVLMYEQGDACGRLCMQQHG